MSVAQRCTGQGDLGPPPGFSPAARSRSDSVNWGNTYGEALRLIRDDDDTEDDGSWDTWDYACPEGR